MLINDNYELTVEDRNVILRKYIEPTEKTRLSMVSRSSKV